MEGQVHRHRDEKVDEQTEKIARDFLRQAGVIANRRRYGALMIGLTLEVYLLARLILGSVRTSLAVAASLLAIFSTLWFVFPLLMRRFHSQDWSMHSLIDLSPYGKNGEMQMVVETSRGSNIKLEYEPKLRAFTVSRLPL